MFGLLAMVISFRNLRRPSEEFDDLQGDGPQPELRFENRFATLAIYLSRFGKPGVFEGLPS
jgi:hypothetical protein